MVSKSLNEIKRDIALVTLDIECLDPSSKLSAILHLKETIDLLHLGNGYVDVKKESNQDAFVSANVTSNDYPVPSASFTQSLYKGLVPTCDFCGARFATVGALDDHMKKCQAVIKQEKRYGDEASEESPEKRIKLDTSEDAPSTDWMFNDSTFDEASSGEDQPPVQSTPENDVSRSLYNGLIPTCDFCGATFATVGDLDAHMNKCHLTAAKEEDVSAHEASNESVDAEVSHSEIKQERSFSDNYDADTEISVTEVPSSLTEETLESHEQPMAQHQNEFTPPSGQNTILKCEQCGQEYKTKSSLAAHKNIHTDKFKCEKCQQPFQSAFALKRHKCGSGLGEVRRRSAEKRVSTETLDQPMGDENINDVNVQPLESNEATEKSSFDRDMETLEAEIMDLGKDLENLDENTGASEKDISSDISINETPIENEEKKLQDIEALEAEIMAEISDIPLQPLEVNNEAQPQQADDSLENLGEDTGTPGNDISSDISIKETTITNEENKLHECPHCGHLYSNLRSLKSHLPIHTDKYKCQTCGTRFVSPSALAKHKCDGTPKNFARKTLVTGYAVAECEVCTMRFNSTGALRSHKIQHTDRFKCEKCGTGFSLLRDLEKHRMNPDSCKTINSHRESFVRRSHILLKPVPVKEEEMMIKTENVQKEDVPAEDSELDDFEMLSCDNCGKYFASQESLDSHVSQCIAEYL